MAYHGVHILLNLHKFSSAVASGTVYTRWMQDCDIMWYCLSYHCAFSDNLYLCWNVYKITQRICIPYKAFYEVRYNIYHRITAYLLEKFNIVDFYMDFKTMSYNCRCYSTALLHWIFAYLFWMQFFQSCCRWMEQYNTQLLNTVLHLLPLPRRLCFHRLSVCLLSTFCKNFKVDLHEISREGWQLASEQMVKFWWRSESVSRHW